MNNIFSNKAVDNHLISSIDGATALKLDEQLEVKSEPQMNENIDKASNSINTVETHQNEQSDLNTKNISIENASYIENNLDIKTSFENSSTAEHTPQLFSEENNEDKESNETYFSDTNNNDKLFDQDLVEDDDDFEIPAFLRKQKF